MIKRILSLTKEEQQQGFVTSSSGNHAQACAYAGKKLGVHVTVVVPDDAPEVKRRNARQWGAEVIAWDRPYKARMQKVESEMKEHGYKMIHVFDFLLNENILKEI